MAVYESSSLRAARPAATTTNHSLFYVYSLLDHGQYEKAVSEFTPLVENNPKWIEAQLGLIRALFQTGNLTAATRTAEKAAHANPESVPVRSMFADLLFRSGRFDTAEAQYQAALALDGNSARAWIGLGKIYSVRSMAAEARRAFQKARESDTQVFSDWVTALASSEQRATYRQYALDNEEQSASPCEISLTGADEGQGSPGPHKQEVRLTPIVGSDGEMRGQGIRAHIDDRTEALLLLDTGASGITIGNRLAKKAGVLNLEERRLPGIGGTGAAHGYVGRISRLQIGELELRNCTVQVSPENKIVGQDGLIGTDVFREYLITLDFPAHKLTLSDRADSAGGAEQNAGLHTAIHAYQFAHMLLVPAAIGQDASGVFVLDSGASTNTVSKSAALKVGGMVSTPRFIEGSTGVLNSVLGTDSAQVKIGEVELNRQRVASVDLSAVSNRLGTEVAGQIGFDFLRNFSIGIDYRTGNLWLQR